MEQSNMNKTLQVTSVVLAMKQALATLMTAWLDVSAPTEMALHQDIVIHINNEPVAVLIPYRDYQKLQQKEILIDIRDGYEARQVFQEWLEDPSTARPYDEFRAELVAEGLLDT